LSANCLYLGINGFTHDASAAIVSSSGEVVAAVEEERFTRRKKEEAFPRHSIAYCLEAAGVELAEIAAVGVPNAPGVYVRRKMVGSNLLREPVGLDVWRRDSELVVSWLTVGRRLRSLFPSQARYPRVQFVRHHDAHAASAFYPSPFEEAAYLTVDGAGEWDCTSWGVFDQRGRRTLGRIGLPHSMGKLYKAVARFLGMTGREQPGKMMGLSAWGRPRYAALFRDVILTQPDGSYRIDYRYFDFKRNPWISQRFIAAFGDPRDPDDELTGRHFDIAASAQAAVEDALLTLLRQLARATGQRAVVLAGGVALNSVMNGRILSETPFESIFVQPAAHDGGLSLGAAHVVASRAGELRRQTMTSAALGPSYTDSAIEEALSQAQGAVAWRRSRDVARETAELVARGKIVAWFQGRLEYGPRALGNRSILADPRPLDMKDRLNRMKAREWFRPFAPAVLEDKAREWFAKIEHSPFMLLVDSALPEKEGRIPAVIHADRTARLQTVRRDVNPLFYSMIEEFERLTGIPIVLNTSFNVAGEPIVCSPADAIRSFARGGFDALAIGPFVATPASAARFADGATSASGQIEAIGLRAT
jgi:carbamoyltransferase